MTNKLASIVVCTIILASLSRMNIAIANGFEWAIGIGATGEDAGA